MSFKTSHSCNSISADIFSSCFALTSSTQKVNPRARGRQFAVRFESSALDANWRLGATRLDIQPDGER